MPLQLWALVLAPPLFLLGVLAWRPGQAIARQAAGWLRMAARRPSRAVALSFVAGVLASALPALVFGPPVPQSHDEFCYLLQADTFASGRLANPTPPLPSHFANPHQLLRPTYAAKYHPGQGLTLAAGQALTGSALPGLWLQCGFLGAALTWMLGAFLPSRWALATSLASVLWLCGASYWGYSYWGGCLPAAAAALVFGATWRLARPRSEAGAGVGALLGLGLVGLALTRPFDGLLASLAAGVVLLAAVWIRPQRGWLPALGGTAGILALGFGWLLLYDRAVTGDPLLMPYVLYERTTASAPFFVWQSPRSIPVNQDPVLANFDRLYETQYRAQRTPSGWLRAAVASLRRAAMFFLGPAFWIAFVALPWRDSRVRFAVAAIALVTAGVLSLVFFMPHYEAPIAPLISLLVALGLRRLRGWRRRSGLGRRAVAGLTAASCGALIVNFLVLGEVRREGWGLRRVELAARLDADRGRDLVFVEFGSGAIDNGWVYNRADLESAPIVWARSIGSREDCDLVARFPGRRVWRLEVRDLATPPRLVEESSAACAATPI